MAAAAPAHARTLREAEAAPAPLAAAATDAIPITEEEKKAIAAQFDA